MTDCVRGNPFPGRIWLPVLFVLVFQTPARGRNLVRTLRRGDRLATLAEYYYGTRDALVVLKIASGFRPFGPRRMRPGQRLTVPTAWTYRIRHGDTWRTLAQDYLGDPRLGQELARDNGKPVNKPPVPGHVIVIPALLRFTPYRTLRVRTLLAVLKNAVHPDDMARLPDRLGRYNTIERNRFLKGRPYVIPLYHLRVRDSLLPSELPNPDPGIQRRLRERMARIQEDLLRGDYESALGMGLRLLPLAQRAGATGTRLCVQVATALVALGHTQAAQEVMSLAKRLSGGRLELDPMEVSPKVRGLLAPPASTRRGHQR